VDVDFEIRMTKLVHSYDLENLEEKVKSLFKWHIDLNERKTYMAPYVPLVQSGGMGKTKLLCELRNRLREGSDTAAK
jgi:hypothetical protein